MNPNRKRVALITGASAGIGYELAKVFAREGYTLVLVARQPERLDAVAQELRQTTKGEVRCIAVDLAEPHASDTLYDEVSQSGLTVDVLVNNAGFGLYGPFSSTDLAAESAMMQLNMVALTRLTKLFLPAMMQQREGRILNVASTAAFQPGPLMAVYFATKAYVLSFSEALANELTGSGVTVTVLCPGPTETEFVKRAKLESSKLFRNQKVMSAAEVAAIGYQGLMAGQTVVVTGLKNQIMASLTRFVPRKTLVQMVRRMQERAV